MKEVGGGAGPAPAAHQYSVHAAAPWNSAWLGKKTTVTAIFL